MKRRLGKALTAFLSVALCLMLVMGIAEVIGMAGGPAVTAQVLGSDGGGSVTPGGGGGGSVTPSKPTYKSNPISVSLKKKTLKINADTIAKSSQKYAKKKYLTVSNAKGTLRFRITDVSKSDKYFSMDKESGQLTIKKGLDAGTYTVSITVIAYGNSEYSKGSDSVKLKVKVSKESLNVKGKTVTADGNTLKTEDVTFAKSKILKITNAGGKQSFSIDGADSGEEFFAISSEGRLTVKSGIEAGTYKVKVQVKTAGNDKYKAGKKTATVTVTVTEADPEPADQTDPTAE